jgi:branched-chain amino acid transport system permease protein
VSGEILWWLNLLVGVGIFTLLAVSLNLINGYAAMFHLGHHGFWAIGAYAAAWMTLAFGASMSGPALYALSLLVAVAVAALGGVAVGLPCLRLRGDYLAIATLAFGEIVRIAVQNSKTLQGSLGLEVPRVLMEVSGAADKIEFRAMTLGIVAALCALVVVFVRNFIRSGHGRRLLAVAQDEIAAGLLGINPTGPRMLAFVLGAAIAGLAGGVHAHYEGRIAPDDFQFMQTVKMFLIIVLGGLGSLSGCVVGAFLVIATERFLTKAGGAVAAWWQVIFPVTLALMILFRPQGIFGGRGPAGLSRKRGARRVA